MLKQTFSTSEKNYISAEKDFLNAASFGASGSAFTTAGTMKKSSNILTLEEEGDYKEGDFLTFDGGFFHVYGTVTKERAPYLAKYQKDLTDELDVEGLDQCRFQQKIPLQYQRTVL